MSRIAQSDIIMELVELINDLVQDTKQQLNYYRASVYKIESAAIIRGKIEQMRIIGTLSGDDSVLEPFQDYEASLTTPNSTYVPGECGFSLRVTTLLKALDALTTEKIKTLHQSANAGQFSVALTQNIQKHRQELLAMCRPGSPQWAFFQTL